MGLIGGDKNKHAAKQDRHGHTHGAAPATATPQAKPTAEIPEVPLPVFVPTRRTARSPDEPEDKSSAPWSDWLTEEEKEEWHYEPPEEQPPEPPKGQWWSGWLPDPRHRHQYRFFDGANWTDHVADNGVAGIDPVMPHS